MSVARVGSLGQFPEPEGGALAERLRVVAGRGELWRADGLADHHAHVMSTTELAEAARWGVSRVVNMAGSPFHRALAAATRNRPELARIQTTSPIIDGHAGGGVAFRQLGLNLRDPGKASTVVRTLRAAGYDDLKVYSNLNQPTFDALAAEAINAGMRVVGHLPNGITHAHAGARGQTRFEHLTGLIAELVDAEHMARVKASPNFATSDEPMRKLLSTVDRGAAARIAEQLAGWDAEICPTLVIHRPFEERPRHPGVVVHPRLLAIWSAQTAAEQAWRRPLLELYLELLREFAEAGVRILAGTDAPDPHTYFGASLFDEIGLLRQAGLSADAAWSAARSTVDHGERGVLFDAAAAERDVVRSIVAVVDHEGRLHPPPDRRDRPGRFAPGDDDPGRFDIVRDRLLATSDWDTTACFEGDGAQLTLRIGVHRAGGLSVLEEESSPLGLAIRLAVSDGATLVHAENHFAANPEWLCFTNCYDVAQPTTVDVSGDFIGARRIPLLAAGGVEVACGNHSLLHPALAARAWMPGGRVVLAGLWGAYPDHEFAYVARLLASVTPSRVEVRSLLYGGYQQSVEFDDTGVPERVTVAYEDIAMDLRRTTVSRG